MKDKNNNIYINTIFSLNNIKKNYIKFILKENSNLSTNDKNDEPLIVLGPDWLSSFIVISFFVFFLFFYFYFLRNLINASIF